MRIESMLGWLPANCPLEQVWHVGSITALEPLRPWRLSVPCRWAFELLRGQTGHPLASSRRARELEGVLGGRMVTGLFGIG